MRPSRVCVLLVLAALALAAMGCGPSLPDTEPPGGPDEPGINQPGNRQPGFCRPSPGREGRSADQIALDAALWKAVRFCDEGAIKDLLVAGADVNATCGKNLTTPLMETVRSYDNKCPAHTAEMLIKAGAAVNMQDLLGSTALHWVTGDNCDHPHFDALRLLLHYGADPTITDCPDCAGCRECLSEQDCQEYRVRRDMEMLKVPPRGETPEQKQARLEKIEGLQDEIKRLREEREGKDPKEIRQCKTPLDLATENKCDVKMGMLADYLKKMQFERKRLLGPKPKTPAVGPAQPSSKRPFLERAPWEGGK